MTDTPTPERSESDWWCAWYPAGNASEPCTPDSPHGGGSCCMMDPDNPHPFREPAHVGPWPLAFVDTETLGLDPDQHAVWEVAVILYDPATGATEEHSRQVWLTAEQIAKGDERGMAVSGFHDRYDPDVAQPPAGVVSWFVDLVGTAHLAGAIPSFDEERLRRLALSFGFPPRWHYHLIDVEAMAVGHLHAIDRYAETVPVDLTLPLGLPWKSDDLADALGVKPITEADRHTALGDARWALRWYQAMTGYPR